MVARHLLPLTLALAALLGGAPVGAGSTVDEALALFEREIASDIDRVPAYEALADALIEGGYIGKGDVPRLLALLSGVIDERTQFIAYKMLGLVLYERGHAEEAHACSEVFQKHSIRIEKALNRAGVLVGGVARELPEEVSGAAQAQLQETRAAVEDAAEDAPAPHRIRLKNGQELDGQILEETEQGVWFQAALGTQMLLGRDEIESISGDRASE